MIVVDGFRVVGILLVMLSTKRNGRAGILGFNVESEKTHLLFVLEGIDVPK